MTLSPEAVAVGLLLLPLLAGGLLLLVWPSGETVTLRSGAVLTYRNGRWLYLDVNEVYYADRVRHRGVEYVVSRWQRPSRTGSVQLTLSRC